MGDMEEILHRDCIRMLRRSSKKKLVEMVMNDLFNEKRQIISYEKDKTFLEKILVILGCNKCL